MSDLYRDLGVSKTASQPEIKKAYRKLARELHPDAKPDDAEAEERFKRVSQAYETLGDEEKRKLYDEFGEASTRPGFNHEAARARQAWGRGMGGGFGGMPGMGGGVDLSDLFGGGRGFGGPRKGRDIHAEITTDFRSAALGGERDLTFQDGRRITVRIPAGVETGNTLRMRGQGGPGREGGPAGDLRVTIVVAPHPVFRREGLDLHVDVPITVGEAVFGGKIQVPTLDGKLKVTVPERTQSQKKLRLKGKGVHRKGKPPGNLYAHLFIHIPEGELDEDALQAVRVLEGAYGESAG
ncbi:MAG: J domain-containing protein [Proteobacteria bacterium]|nr:J domain-containing protein [Pseudomonadota bacterium]MCP4922335.1 J domain-containing protein [Pseudomonadota bacterium]